MRNLVLLFSLLVLYWSPVVHSAEPNPRVEELQQGLTELGYDPGLANGIMGQKTRAAVSAFQKDHDQSVDGAYSKTLLNLIELEVRKKKIRKLLSELPDHDLRTFVKALSQKELWYLSQLAPEKFMDLSVNAFAGKWLPSDAIRIVNSIPLRQLLYPAAAAGIRQFQADIGAEPTGELTIRQFFELSRRYQRQRDTPVYAPGMPKIFASEHTGYATVQGTWVKESGQIENPIHHSKITCRRARR